jgi:hypothetical protein
VLGLLLLVALRVAAEVRRRMPATGRIDPS